MALEEEHVVKRGNAGPSPLAPEDAIDDAISRNVVHFDITASRARRWTYLALIGLVGVAITVLAWQAVSM